MHTDPDIVPEDLVAMQIDVSRLPCEVHTDDTLPEHWRDVIGGAHTLSFGAAWIDEKRSALLVVPSVLLLPVHVGQEANVMINPLHPEAEHIRIMEQLPFTFDPRLLRVQ